MTLARLLAAVLLLCTLPAFAQHNPGTPSAPPALQPVPDFRTPAAKPADLWTTIPELEMNPARPALGNVSSDQGKIDLAREAIVRFMASIPFDPNSQTLTVKASPDRKILAWELEDRTCLTMRSYVVARDSKDSDSTHLVSYSTCQPGARYQVRTTEMRLVSPDR
jgi:hypothetical protein